MSHKGRLLELLVKSFESALAGENVEVRSPERFKGADGNIIGEIDITLRGKFGSATMFIGVECRDRPADGPQGVDWIHEIKGKQHYLKVDRMIAVSTTGFTKPAQEAALKAGIDLRHVRNREDVEVSGWVEIINFEFIENMQEFRGIIDVQTLPTIAVDLPIEALSIVTPQGEISISEYIKLRIDNLFEKYAQKLTPNGPKLETILEITEPLYGRTVNADYVINKVTVPLRLWREKIRVKTLLSLYSDIENNDIIALGGRCTVETKTRNFQVILTMTKSRNDPAKRDLKVSFLTEDGQPYPLDMSSYQLLGRRRKDR